MKYVLLDQGCFSLRPSTERTRAADQETSTFFNSVLCESYFFQQTRILVTHGVAFLTQVDKIIVLVDGRITEVSSLF